MTDKGDNTYEFIYLLDRPGEITISAYRIVNGRGVFASYWANKDNIAGAPDFTQTIDSPSEVFDSSTTPITAGTAAVRYDYLLIGPKDGSVDFNFNANTKGEVSIEGTSFLFSRYPITGFRSFDFVNTKQYKVQTSWEGNLQNGRISTKWDLDDGNGRVEVHNSYVIPVTEIVPTFALTIVCPSGKTKKLDGDGRPE